MGRWLIDRDWFEEHMRKLDVSLREMSSRLTVKGTGNALPPSELSRMLSGKREMAEHTRLEVARLFGVSPEEVRARALGEEPTGLTVAAKVDSDQRLRVRVDLARGTRQPASFKGELRGDAIVEGSDLVIRVRLPWL
jgi:hypothetical protein